MRPNLREEQLGPPQDGFPRMGLAPWPFMSAVRSTLWGTVVVVALLIVFALAYGSCYSWP